MSVAIFDIIINALKNSYISIFMYLPKDFIDIHSPKENLLGFFLLKRTIGTCLVVQWLRVHAPNAEGMTSIPGWGTKILHAKWYGLKKKKKKKNKKERNLYEQLSFRDFMQQICIETLSRD